MKIAYVHNGLWPSPSPSTTFSTMTAWALAGQAEQVHFFIQRNSKQTPDEVLTNYFSLNRPPALIIHDVPKGKILNSNQLYYWRVYRELIQLLKQKNLDVVITRNTAFLPYFEQLSRNYGVKSYFESHNFYTDLTHHQEKEDRRHQKLELKYLPKISGIICLQNAQRRLYLNHYPDRHIFTARTGIHKIIQHSFAGEYLGYVGSLDDHKGVTDLLQAAAKSSVQPKLLIIGGKNEAEILSRTKEYGQIYDPQKFKITGWMNKDDLYRALPEIRVGFIPLKDTFFNRFLTPPLKTFDYYAFGIPMIASDLPTMRELIDDSQNGWLYPPGDVEALSEIIDRVYNDRPRLEAVSLNNYQRAEQYLWSRRAELIVSEIGGNRG